MSGIKYNCPNCGHGLLIPEQYAGMRGSCKHCKAEFTVPSIGPKTSHAPIINIDLDRPVPPVPKATEAGAKSFAQWFGGTVGISAGIAAGCAIVPLLMIGGCVVLVAIGSQQTPVGETYRATSEALLPAETAVPPPAEPQITLVKFNQLQNGHTYEQAVQILGVHGTLISENTLAGYHTAMYSWENPGILQGSMNAMFQNNALMSKSQLGLK